MLGEPQSTVALKVINEINGKLKLYRKNKYLTKELDRMPRFDYVDPAWYPNFNENMKKKMQIMQYKCTCLAKCIICLKRSLI